MSGGAAVGPEPGIVADYALADGASALGKKTVKDLVSLATSDDRARSFAAEHESVGVAKALLWAATDPDWIRSGTFRADEHRLAGLRACLGLTIPSHEELDEARDRARNGKNGRLPRVQSRSVRDVLGLSAYQLNGGNVAGISARTGREPKHRDGFRDVLAASLAGLVEQPDLARRLRMALEQIRAFEQERDAALALYERLDGEDAERAGMELVQEPTEVDTGARAGKDASEKVAPPEMEDRDSIDQDGVGVLPQPPLEVSPLPPLERARIGRQVVAHAPGLWRRLPSHARSRLNRIVIVLVTFLVAAVLVTDGTADLRKPNFGGPIIAAPGDPREWPVAAAYWIPIDTIPTEKNGPDDPRRLCETGDHSEWLRAHGAIQIAAPIAYHVEASKRNPITFGDFEARGTIAEFSQPGYMFHCGFSDDRPFSGGKVARQRVELMVNSPEELGILDKENSTPPSANADSQVRNMEKASNPAYWNYGYGFDEREEGKMVYRSAYTSVARELIILSIGMSSSGSRFDGTIRYSIWHESGVSKYYFPYNYDGKVTLITFPPNKWFSIGFYQTHSKSSEAEQSSISCAFPSTSAPDPPCNEYAARGNLSRMWGEPTLDSLLHEVVVQSDCSPAADWEKLSSTWEGYGAVRTFSADQDEARKSAYLGAYVDLEKICGSTYRKKLVPQTIAFGTPVDLVVLTYNGADDHEALLRAEQASAAAALQVPCASFGEGASDLYSVWEKNQVFGPLWSMHPKFDAIVLEPLRSIRARCGEGYANDLRSRLNELKIPWDQDAEIAVNRVLSGRS